MLIDTLNPSQVVLQIQAQNLDGTPKTALTSAHVRVYHMNGGVETEDLSSTVLVQVGSTSTWRYVWTPTALPAGHYFAEYALVDSDGASFVAAEDIDIRDLATETETVLAEYLGAICINTMDGVSGTTPPIGTSRMPVSNLADAQTLAATLGFRKYRIDYGSLTLTDAHDRWEFEGNAAGTHVKIGNTVNNSHFNGMQISGDGVGSPYTFFENCILWPDTSNIAGVFRDCVITDVLYLAAGDIIFNNCTSLPSPYCTLDAQGNSVRIRVAGFNGEIHLRNFGAGSYADFDMVGKVTLEDTCTGGIIEVRGEVELVDESTGALVYSKAAVNTREDIQTKVTFIRKIEKGRWRIVGEQMIFYEEDDTTPLLTFDLKDINGLPSNVNIFERDPV